MKLYRRFFKYIEHNSKYIDDFSNISTFRQGISTYRQKLTVETTKEAVQKYILEQPPLLTHYCTSFYIKQTTN
ncbi:hypothetical protein CWC47_09410 [Bacillus paranthracis]|nr:hypothetical protein [Bacillus paranthracis]PCC79906.1 hypothetical protein CNQ76_08085 [Bacillus cereus]PDR76571.1 hypothetical protein CNQ81_12000 [Bacillus cereus]PDR82642.1 hypothetical protein CNQ79_11770 [Bacillus cereus]PDR89066.1 hypothetical protein CNQ77_07975 [Bacillus cereus]